MEFSILIFTIIFMSLIYLLIGFGINKVNAKYLLAGYNTMTAEQKQKFNIEKYLAIDIDLVSYTNAPIYLVYNKEFKV